MKEHILSIVWLTPLVGMFILLLLPKENKQLIRIVANLAAFAGFLVSLPLVFLFDNSIADYQFVERVSWIPALGVEYYLGIDGISLLLIMLTTVVGFLSILSSWTAIEERVKEYYAFFLFLQAGMLGVFMALDLFLFYVFWEIMLVPMYFIIGIWGHARRLYAAIKFFLYTLAGSVLMLLAMLALYFKHAEQFGVYTFAIEDLMRTQIPLDMQIWLFWGFFIAFAVKVADVPAAYLASGCPYRSPHGGFGDPGGRPAENGALRTGAVLDPAVAGSRERCDHGADHRRAIDHRDHLRCARFADAEELEEAHRVFLGEPPGLLHARHHRAEPERHRRRHSSGPQSRPLDAPSLPGDRHCLRAAARA